MSTEKRIETIEHDGLVFDVLDEGPIGGEPVVLLHGWPERATVWRHVAPILNAAGYRTYTPDRRGFAPGARPKRRRDYTLPKLAGDIAALIDQVGGSAHVVGHDWGAATAWAVAGFHPEKVRTLTAVSVGHPASFMKAMVKSDQLRRSWYVVSFQLPFVPELIAKYGGAGFDRQLIKSGMTKDDVARVRAEIIDDGAFHTSLGCYRAVPLTDPRSVRFRITAPTTMVWSAGEVPLSRYGAERSADWCDGPFEFVALERGSHWLPTEAPDVLADIILERIQG
ncbi:alpha/beta fold hydrolase [Nocardioides humilatus]|uniref:Alpha/beta fold hydrolase n=1 Tax=Nocardioides humilatus TaxID=2607660 RepID=A0A5B1LHY3_9ACTN|nr:alpha/beta fold hydrolase [Nocardioides humilatus]KAA1419259.1 alpha/beta fold hydrolase [Nocardioides humilatus]